MSLVYPPALLGIHSCDLAGLRALLCSITTARPDCFSSLLSLSVFPHPASQWLEAVKDGTSEAAVSHSARLLVHRKAACCHMKWLRLNQQSPETHRRKIFFYNYYNFLKDRPENCGHPCSIFHTLSPFPTSNICTPSRLQALLFFFYQHTENRCSCWTWIDFIRAELEDKAELTGSIVDLIQKDDEVRRNMHCSFTAETSADFCTVRIFLGVLEGVGLNNGGNCPVYGMQCNSEAYRHHRCIPTWHSRDTRFH